MDQIEGDRTEVELGLEASVAGQIKTPEQVFPEKREGKSSLVVIIPEETGIRTLDR